MKTFQQSKVDNEAVLSSSVPHNQNGQEYIRIYCIDQHPPLSPSVHSQNLQSNPHSFTSKNLLSDDEWNTIRNEWSGVVLNESDDEDENPDLEDNDFDDSSLIPFNHRPDIHFVGNPGSDNSCPRITTTRTSTSYSNESPSLVLNSNCYSCSETRAANYSKPDAILNIPRIEAGMALPATGISDPITPSPITQSAAPSYPDTSNTGLNLSRASNPLSSTSNYINPESRTIPLARLNRCNTEELDANRDSLNYSQLNFLRSVKDKIKERPKKFRKPKEYLPQSQILLLTDSWEKAKAYSCCCIPSPVNRSGHCNLHRFCPCCSYFKAHEKRLEYVPVYDEGNWFFVTCSFSNVLKLNSQEDAALWRHCWDAYDSAIRSLVKSGTINGVVWSEELAIASLLPVQCRPHIHCIVEAKTMNVSILKQIQAQVLDHLALTSTIQWRPDLQSKSMDSQLSLSDHIGYMFKPLDLATPYLEAWPRAELNDRELAAELNAEVDLVVKSYTNVTAKRHKIRAAGNLSTTSQKRFIGIRKAKRRQYKKYLSILHLTRGGFCIETPKHVIYLSE